MRRDRGIGSTIAIAIGRDRGQRWPHHQVFEFEYYCGGGMGGPAAGVVACVHARIYVHVHVVYV